MKKFKHTLIAGLLVSIVGLGCANGTSQSNNEGDPDSEPKTQTIKINKGQMMDVLSAIRNPETDESRDEYFGKVFPPATKNGFKMHGTFLTVAPPTQGNFHAQFFGIMSWPNTEGRNKFQEEAKSMDYDYKKARKSIWSVFNLTFYEDLKEDVEFTVREDKIYVITSYWVDDMKAFKKSKKEASPKMKKAGGKLTLLLGKGESPMEYLYEPDVMSITEWDSQEAFDKYLAENNNSTRENGIKNVNQWKTQFLFNSGS